MRCSSLLAVLLLGGCGAALSPEQQVVQRHLGSGKTIVKWWPVVPADMADLPGLIAAIKENKPTSGVDMEWEMVHLMATQYETEGPPTHLVRVKFQGSGEKGAFTNDQIFHVAGDKVVGGWFPPKPGHKLPWLEAWMRKVYPGSETSTAI